jgi:hypothetical protein
MLLLVQRNAEQLNKRCFVYQVYSDQAAVDR